MELRQMIYFKELAEQLNLNVAASNLYITPQALSKSMRSLAEEFQIEIFYRDHGKLCLTDFGESMYSEVTALLQEIHKTTESLKNKASQERGTIQIAYSIGVYRDKIESFFQNYQELHPELTLDLIELPDLFTEQYVNEEKCDFGFSIGIPENDENFEYVLLEHHQLCAIVKKEHPLANNTTITLKECSPYLLITKNKTFKSYEIMYHCANRQGLKLNTKSLTLNVMFQNQLNQETNGIGIGTTYLIPDKKTTFAYIPFSDTELKWDIYLIIKKGHYLSKAAHSMINDLLSSFK